MAKCGSCGGTSGCGCLLNGSQAVDGGANSNPSIAMAGAGTPTNPYIPSLAFDSDTSYVPTIAGFTLGTGGSNATAYRRFGKEVTAIHVLILGTGFVLPSTLVIPLHPKYPLVVSYGTNRPIGVCNLEDVSATSQYMGILSGSGSPLNVQMNAMGASGIRTALSATVPFTWAAGDKLEFLFKYTTP